MASRPDRSKRQGHRKPQERVLKSSNALGESFSFGSDDEVDEDKTPTGSRSATPDGTRDKPKPIRRPDEEGGTKKEWKIYARSVFEQFAFSTPDEHVFGGFAKVDGAWIGWSELERRMRTQQRKEKKAIGMILTSADPRRRRKVIAAICVFKKWGAADERTSKVVISAAPEGTSLGKLVSEIVSPPASGKTKKGFVFTNYPEDLATFYLGIPSDVGSGSVFAPISRVWQHFQVIGVQSNTIDRMAWAILGNQARIVFNTLEVSTPPNDALQNASSSLYSLDKIKYDGGTYLTAGYTIKKGGERKRFYAEPEQIYLETLIGTLVLKKRHGWTTPLLFFPKGTAKVAGQGYEIGKVGLILDQGTKDHSEYLWSSDLEGGLATILGLSGAGGWCDWSKRVGDWYQQVAKLCYLDDYSLGIQLNAENTKEIDIPRVDDTEVYIHSGTFPLQVVMVYTGQRKFMVDSPIPTPITTKVTRPFYQHIEGKKVEHKSEGIITEYSMPRIRDLRDTHSKSIKALSIVVS